MVDLVHLNAGCSGAGDGIKARANEVAKHPLPQCLNLLELLLWEPPLPPGAHILLGLLGTAPSWNHGRNGWVADTEANCCFGQRTGWPFGQEAELVHIQEGSLQRLAHKYVMAPIIGREGRLRGPIAHERP